MHMDSKRFNLYKMVGVLMVASNKIKDDSSRAITTLLFNVLDAVRQGDIDIADSIGLDIESMRELDTLKPDQIAQLSNRYMKERCAVEIFNLDSTKLSSMIKIAAQDTQLFEMSDEFLKRGASKKMMKDLFGMRSTQVANRKKFLNIESLKGRSTIVSHEEERAIYDAWLASIKNTDYRTRLLTIAKETNLALWKIDSVVTEIEEINNSMNIAKRYA